MDRYNEAMVVVLILAIIYVGSFFLRFGDVSQTAWLGAGVAIGILGYYLDSIWFVKWYAEPGQVSHPVTRSLWLLLVYWPLAIFMVTSTGSLLGMGLILGLGGGLTWDILTQLRTEEMFKTFFSIPQRSQLNHQEILLASWVWIVGFLILVLTRLW